MKKHDRISEVPENFNEVFRRQLSLADDLRNGKVDVDQGDAEAKALYGATKVLEGDLHARMFESKLLRQSGSTKQLPAGKAA